MRTLIQFSTTSAGHQNQVFNDAAVVKGDGSDAQTLTSKLQPF